MREDLPFLVSDRYGTVRRHAKLGTLGVDPIGEPFPQRFKPRIAVEAGEDMSVQGSSGHESAVERFFYGRKRRFFILS